MSSDLIKSCPFCKQEVHKLVEKFESLEDSALLLYIKSLKPEWEEKDGICSHCLDSLHVRTLKQLVNGDDELFTPLPIPLRLKSDSQYSGEGVTICMIDSGFYLHPDIADRVLKIIDITDPSRELSYYEEPHNESWHGTMTSVVAAGDGKLSGELYKGIASKARLALLKVMNEEGISSQSITTAINWAIQHREEFNIKIINLSVTDDWPISYKDSSIDQAVERAINSGIVVVAAVGNDSGAPVKPPANSPWAISVGGIDDYNTLGFEESMAYHSTFGYTIDNFSKPEIISPSIWIPVPILPKTDLHRKAEALFNIYEAHDIDFWKVFSEFSQYSGIDTDAQTRSIVEMKSLVKRKISDEKLVSRDYMHGDGTSFAAPITAAIIAQMIEANRNLLPHQIRDIILNTAIFLPHIPAEIQGFGVINPGLATDRATSEIPAHYKRLKSPEVDKHIKRITFRYHDDYAKMVVCTGSFNNWKEKIDMKKNLHGIWEGNIPLLPGGRYLYKFIIDDQKWTEDPSNLYKESDGLNGFNSILIV